MKILYISKRFEENVCATIHYQTLKKIAGNENVYTINLSPDKKAYTAYNYIAFGKYKSKFERILRNLTLQPYTMSNAVMGQICDIIKEEKTEIVFVDESIYGKLVKKIKRNFPQIKILTFYHDIERVLYREWLGQRGIRFMPEYLVTVIGEYLNQKFSDYNLLLNERDARLFFENYHKKNEGFLPMCVPYPDFENNVISEISNDNYGDKPKILFVGNRYYPNVNGLKWFIQNVWSRISRDNYLFIVGRGLEELRGSYGVIENVVVVGGVESLAPFYINANIVIAPIFEGGGMKQKTAEALAYGKCFVGSKESLEGYYEVPEIRSCNKIVCGDSADDFVSAIKNFNFAPNYNSDVFEIYIKYFSPEAAERYIKRYLV